jgi:hypothetical protein
MSPAEFVRMSLWARDAASEIESAPQTFSSWDKCMEKTYCKYASDLTTQCLYPTSIESLANVCADGLSLLESLSEG